MQRGVAVTEFRSVIDLDRHPGEPLNQMFRDEARVPGRTTGTKKKSINVMKAVNSPNKSGIDVCFIFILSFNFPGIQRPLNLHSLNF